MIRQVNCNLRYTNTRKKERKKKGRNSQFIDLSIVQTAMLDIHEKSDTGAQFSVDIEQAEISSPRFHHFGGGID